MNNYIIFFIISFVIVALVWAGKEISGEVGAGILIGPIHKGTNRFAVQVAFPDDIINAPGGMVRIGRNTYQIKHITPIIGGDNNILFVTVKGALDNHSAAVPVLFF